MLILVCLVSSFEKAAGQGVHPPEAPRHEAIPTTQPVSSEAAHAWRADLDQLTHELVKRHGDAFHTVSPDAFRASVNALRARIPELPRHAIIVEMQRIVASIGDGHTSLPLLFDPAVGFHALPVRLGWYEEGIFVEGGAESLGDIIGSRLVSIGGISIEDAVARVTPLVSRDNDMWIRVMAPAYLRMTEVLHATGLSLDPMSAELTFEHEGARHSITVQALPAPLVVTHGPQEPPVPDWLEARETASDVAPLYLRHPDRAYWREYLPGEETLYVQYNQVTNVPHGPGVEAFFAETLRFVDQNPVRRLVLDIRNNGGGEGNLNYAVVREILRRPEIDRPGGLFVLIGRGTFSAAQVLAHWLDRWTNAEFVGEPTGSSPQFWGDRSSFRLEHSGILAGASPTWWQPGGPYDTRPYLPPSLAFEPTWADWVANRDPALEAILAWEDRVTLSDAVLEILPSGAGAHETDPVSRRAAASAVRAWSSDPIHRYQRATSELNRLGYRLLREDRPDLALAVFRLNVEVHPDYANGWDSLGETLLARGEREEGLEAYRQAYALDPTVGRAAEVLGHEREDGQGR